MAPLFRMMDLAKVTLPVDMVAFPFTVMVLDAAPRCASEVATKVPPLITIPPLKELFALESVS